MFAKIWALSIMSYMSIITKIFGDPNQKVLDNLNTIVADINQLEPTLKQLSDQQLADQTQKLKDFLAQGKSLEDILPEAFATVREAAYRTIGQRHYDVQLLAGIVMHQGKIAEMKTGEGKTLAATCPLYLNALTGQSSHLVTVNDYLARIHADWMGRVFNFLGLTVSCIGQQTTSHKYNPNKAEQGGDEQLDVQYLEACSRSEAYACDVVYGTNNEFGFDYLRDNMVNRLSDKVQTQLHFAIVDEVDSILIDEARTPLIISAPDMESTDKYYQFAQIVRTLKENEDYNIDEKMKAATLSDSGISKVEKALGVDNIYTDRGINDVHHIEQALKAQTLFKKDKNYVVKDGEIVIIDEFTGRMMFGRRYSEGLHQAIEAKENVKVQRESRTLATISFQNYFRLYAKLAGMTGTAATEAEEFSKIYNLEVVVVPTNKPVIRQDLNDRIYKNEAGKYQALVREIKERHDKGQPVLIGTISIEKNEMLADLLSREGVDCQILNAKHHDQEAHIIAQAGKPGAVTVATNMAGRGVDIILGGHPFDQVEYAKVVAAGGLCVIGTERHESRRIDNQLRGRSGRQGDPGSSQFYISMDDDLMRIFGSDRMKKVMTTLGVPDDMPIENAIISRSIEQAQKKVEGNNFDIRKHLVEYDDVMNKQRETIYRKRQQILEGQDIKQMVVQSVLAEIESIVLFHTQAEDESRWDLNEIYEAVSTIFQVPTELRKQLAEIEVQAGDSNQDNMARAKIIGYLNKLAIDQLNELEKNINQLTAQPGHDQSENMSHIAKGMMLRSLDTLWIEHLETMQHLRTGIGLRGYGQRDPLVEYKREAMRLFKDLLVNIDKQITYSIFKIGLVAPAAMQMAQAGKMIFSAPAKTSGQKSPMQADQGLQDRQQNKSVVSRSKVGRNNPCPCGSGKKYKKCCGQ